MRGMQPGERGYKGVPRNLEVIVCPIFLLANYFFMRFTFHSEPFPDPTNVTVWCTGRGRDSGGFLVRMHTQQVWRDASNTPICSRLVRQGRQPAGKGAGSSYCAVHPGLAISTARAPPSCLAGGARTCGPKRPTPLSQCNTRSKTRR